MDNNRFLKITIIILLMVNISTLVFMWTGRQHHQGHMPPPHGQGNAFEFLVRQLKLDESQVKQYEVLRTEHHEGAMKIQQKSSEMHHRFFDLLKNLPADSTLSVQLADSMAIYQKQIELFTFNHFKKVRDICNPEQQKKFDQVINEALEMMGPHPPKGPGGPDGPPPPPQN